MLSSLKRKNSLLRISALLWSGNAVSYLLLFFTSVLIFRSVDRSEYGLYAVLMAYFAIFELFVNGYNQTILRYLKEDIRDTVKQKIVLYVIYYKYALLLFFLFIFFTLKEINVFSYLIQDYTAVENSFENFIELAIATSIVSILLGVSQTILLAQYEYKFVTMYGIYRKAVYLIIVVTLIFFTNEYLIYLYAGLVTNIILWFVMVYKINLSHKAYGFLALYRNKTDFSIYKDYMHSYATPLTATSVLTYAKNNIPIIVLGKEFSLEDVAIFSILKKLFKSLHSLTGSFIGTLVPKIVAIKNDTKQLKLVMNSIFYGSISFRLAVYLLFTLLLEYFFIIYNIQDIEINRLVFIILGLEYVIAGMSADGFFTYLQLQHTTSPILKIALTRFVFEMTLIYFFLIEYGMIAAALILLISRLIETITSYLFVRKAKIFRYGFLSILLSSIAVLSILRMIA